MKHITMLIILATLSTQSAHAMQENSAEQLAQAQKKIDDLRQDRNDTLKELAAAYAQNEKLQRIIDEQNAQSAEIVKRVNSFEKSLSTILLNISARADCPKPE